jgi:microsomal dipeptidase-like Zn-dependent dipeptidase
MAAGGLDVAWFIVYTGQSTLDEAGYAAAYANAIDKFDAIHRLAEDIAPDEIGIAYTSDDVKRLSGEGKQVAMIGIENAYPVGLDLANIKDFHDRGGRYMSLAHNGHSQFADSNTGENAQDYIHGGLSELGREALAEMNKWGIIIDVSHPSKDAIMQMLALTRAPLIASHSSARALTNHTRNLDDEMLLAIKDNGGVVQTVAFGSYINEARRVHLEQGRQALTESIASALEIDILAPSGIAQLSDAARGAYEASIEEVTAQVRARVGAEVNATAPPATVADFVDHIDYMVGFIGEDHVGISSDFDGGGGIEGWNDASETFNVTLELVRRGYTEQQIEKMWSGNLLRVLDEVQAVAARIQAE